MLRMAMLVLALILVTCSQVAKPMTITVPGKFNGILGKCDLAEKHNLKKALPQKGTIDACAAACDGDDDCASFHFTGKFDGGDEGNCVYSSFICIDGSSISQPEDKTAYRVYITKGTVAWTESAGRKIVSESQKRTFQNQTIYYTEGCCTMGNDNYCADNKNSEAEEAGTEIKSSTDCYSACVNKDKCASFRIKWAVPEDVNDETGTCFTSQHACSFTANDQAGRIIDAERSEALSYFLVERLKGAGMIAEKEQIHVGTTTAMPDTSTAPTTPTTPTTPASPDTSTATRMPDTSTSGSGRAAAAILAVALAWSILTLAMKSIV